MKVYAIRDKQTNQLVRFDGWKRNSPKFYSKPRFAKASMTNHYKSFEDYEIVEFELTNERIVS